MSQILQIRPGKSLTIEIEDQSSIDELISKFKDCMIDLFIPNDHDLELIISGVSLRDDNNRTELFSCLEIEEDSEQATMLMNATLIHIHS